MRFQIKFYTLKLVFLIFSYPNSIRPKLKKFQIFTAVTTILKQLKAWQAKDNIANLFTFENIYL